MRKSFIEPGHPQLSVRRQSGLLKVNRNRLQPKAREGTAEDLVLCRAIDELHLKRPYYGSRRVWKELRARRMDIGRGKVRRLMRRMGLVATYPKPRTSQKSPENKFYPYLLRDVFGWEDAFAWKDAIAFALLIVILVVKPTGLLGKPIREKV